MLSDSEALLRKADAALIHAAHFFCASQLLDADAAHRLSTPSRRRSSAAPSLFQSPRTEALASLCTCFFAPRFSAPMHVLWPLIPRSAGHIPAIPPHVIAIHRQGLSSLRHCQSMPFFSKAILSRAYPLPIFSIAEHSLAAADRSCSAAYRSFALASQCSSELFHCASARCTSMQFLGHSRHCHANATLSLLSKSIAPQSSALLFHCWS